MTKELFTKSINAIEKQHRLDLEIARNLAKVFTDAGSANLLPNNHFLQNALMELLQVEMKDDHKDSWIEHYCWELDFGKKKHLKITQHGKPVKMNNASDLYDFLIKQTK
jgi:hypothetical protein